MIGGCTGLREFDPRRVAAVARMAAVLLILSIAAAAPVPAKEISGSRVFTGEVVVPKGETWTVPPGTAIRFRGGTWTVRGTLRIEGTSDRPVRIAGDEAFEGIDFRGGGESSVSGAVISGGRRGARVTNASVTFRGVRWEGHGVGLDAGQYAKVALVDCDFASPSRVGLLVRRGGAADVLRTRFDGAGKAGLYVSGAKDVSVRECRFRKNAVGLQASLSGASVSVSGSAFEENGTGLLIEKMAAPAVTGCDIAGNGTGLLFSRRAAGTVAGSRIAGNGDGVVVEYSSYPVFRENRFRDNRRYAVRLRHQSSQWEEERGDTDRDTGGTAGAPFGGREGRETFRPGGEGAAAGPPPKRIAADGAVDFRGNDWGNGAAEKSGDANLSLIHDGRDEPAFEYKGRRYRMDVVLLR